MKVLEKGLTEVPVWEIRCTGKGITGAGCKALLEFEENDIFKVYGGGYTENIAYCGIRCPVCKSQTCLEDEGVKIPSSIMSKRPDRIEWYKKNNFKYGE